MTNLNNFQLSNFSRVDIKPDQYEQLIYQKGTWVVWEKSILCSCIDEDSGKPDFTCTACKGKGFSYFDPQKIRLAVTSIGGKDENIPIGMYDVGTAYVTTMAKDLVNFRDRLTFLDFQSLYSQVLTYSGEAVELKYEVEEVVSARILSHEIPPEEYYLSEDRKQLIINEGVLSFGERFTVLVKVKPTYIVIDMPHELRGTYVKFGNAEEKWTILPRQLMIKREDLIALKRGEVI